MNLTITRIGLWLTSFTTGYCYGKHEWLIAGTLTAAVILTIIGIHYGGNK